MAENILWTFPDHDKDYSQRIVSEISNNMQFKYMFQPGLKRNTVEPCFYDMAREQQNHIVINRNIVVNGLFYIWKKDITIPLSSNTLKLGVLISCLS